MRLRPLACQLIVTLVAVSLLSGSLASAQQLRIETSVFVGRPG